MPIFNASFPSSWYTATISSVRVQGCGLDRLVEITNCLNTKHCSQFIFCQYRGWELSLFVYQGMGNRTPTKNVPRVCTGGGGMITGRNEQRIQLRSPLSLTPSHGSLFISHPPHFLVLAASLCLCTLHSGPMLFSNVKHG